MPDVVQSIPSQTIQFDVTFDVTNGDHRNPNRHKFNKMSLFFPSGSQSWSSVNPCLSYVWTGPQVVALNNSLSSFDASNEVYNRALASLYAKVRGDLDLSISAFEADKTVAMLRSLRRLSTFVDGLKPKNWGNSWLMWQYGMRPLVDDVYKTASKLIAGQGFPPVHVRTRAKQITTKEDIYSYFAPGVPQKRTCWASYRCMFDIVFDFKPSVITELAGWSSVNPISIAWELLPYSFVADWLYNVGGYLRNTENALLYGQAFKSGYYVQTHKIHRTSRVSGGYSDSTGSGSVNCEFVSFEASKYRTVLSSAPFPRPPSFKVDLGSSQVISAAALLLQPLQKLGRIK